VSKKGDSRYKSGRSSAWRKTKCWSSGEFVVVGTEHVAGHPPTALLARRTDHDLIYAGSAFVTLAEPERELFWRRAEQLAAERPAIQHLRNSKARWCRPDMHVNVRHLRGGGMLRHAIVAGVL
jgi:ATP-dependent DNA ligase